MNATITFEPALDAFRITRDDGASIIISKTSPTGRWLQGKATA